MNVEMPSSKQVICYKRSQPGPAAVSMTQSPASNDRLSHSLSLSTICIPSFYGVCRFILGGLPRLIKVLCSKYHDKMNNLARRRREAVPRAVRVGLLQRLAIWPKNYD